MTRKTERMEKRRSLPRRVGTGQGAGFVQCTQSLVQTWRSERDA